MSEDVTLPAEAELAGYIVGQDGHPRGCPYQPGPWATAWLAGWDRAASERAAPPSTFHGRLIVSTAPQTVSWSRGGDAESWGKYTGCELPKGPWRVAKNPYNTAHPPWRDAVAIEDMSDPCLAVPGIVCWLTRGGNQVACAELIAEAPRLAARIVDLEIRLAAETREHDDASEGWETELTVARGRIAELEGEVSRLRQRAEVAQSRGFHVGVPEYQAAQADARVRLNAARAERDRPIPPRKGDFVTCEAGHLVCEVVGGLLPAWDRSPIGAEQSWPGLGAWRASADKNGLCECGKPWFRYRGQPNCTGPALHIKGRGWV